MATIPLRRGYALGGRSAPGAPVIQFPLNSGQTGYPGYLVTLSSGKGNIVQSATGDLVGVLESKHSNSADGEIATVALFVPGSWWEFSVNGGASAGDTLRGMVVGFENPGGDYEFTTVGDSTSTGFRIVFFASDQGVYETHRFIAGNATTETAGATNTPQADLGVAGDTNPRVVGVPDLDHIVLG